MSSAAPAPSAANRLVEQALTLHESALISYAAHLLNGDYERARDVVQDCFLKLYLADPQRIRDNLKPWLYTVCRNRALDHLRKDRRLDFDSDHHNFSSIRDQRPDPSQSNDTHELYDRAWSLLSQLTTNQREVIRLKFQHDCSYKEIAEITGLTAGNVGFLMHTGLKKLRELLNQDLKITNTVL
jgi:RNA polymerase sigma-70 factor (ECF subfamily)